MEHDVTSRGSETKAGVDFAVFFPQGISLEARDCAINWVVVAQKLVSVASRSPQQWLANSEIYPWTDFIGNSSPLFITGIECHDS